MCLTVLLWVSLCMCESWVSQWLRQVSFTAFEWKTNCEAKGSLSSLNRVPQTNSGRTVSAEHQTEALIGSKSYKMLKYIMQGCWTHPRQDQALIEKTWTLKHGLEPCRWIPLMIWFYRSVLTNSLRKSSFTPLQ